MACCLSAGSAPGQEADPAAKKLAAANGLFQRQLYKLAAEQYDQFLREFPLHEQALPARYALAVSRYRAGEFAAAIKDLGLVINEGGFGERDEALLVLGHSHLSLGEHDKAVGAFDELLAKHPASRSAEMGALNRAQALYLAGKKAEAANAAEDFLKRHPDSARRPDAFYYLALGRHGAGEQEAALAALRELERNYPESRYATDALLMAGQALEAQGKTELAVEQYERLIEKAPEARKAEGHFALGAALYKLSRYEASEKTLTALLERYPASAHVAAARMQLGLTQWAGRRVAAARQTLAGVVESDPARVNVARYWVAQCDIAEGRFAEAKRSLDELAKLSPPPVAPEKMALAQAECLLGLEQFEAAAGAFEAYQAAYPRSGQVVEAAYRQSLALHKGGKLEASLAAAQGVVDGKHPQWSRPARELVAENLFQLDRFKEAEPVFAHLTENATEAIARDRHALRRAQCVYFTGDYGRSTELLKGLAEDAAAAKDPLLSRAILLYGDALLQLGRYGESAEVLGRFLNDAPPDSESGLRLEANFKLGLAQLRGEELAGAEKTLSEVMNMGEASPWIMRAAFEFGQLKWKQNQPQAAREPLTRVAIQEDAPDELRAPAAYLLAWIELDARKFDEAAKQFSELSEKYPRHPLASDAMFHMGVALREGGKTQAAATTFRAYLTSTRGEGGYAQKARQLLAATLVKLGKHEEAIATLRGLMVDRSAVTDESLYDLAWSQAAVKDTAGAEENYRRLLKEFPKSRLAAAARSELGELLFQQEKHEEAAKLLQEVIADETADARTRAVATYRLASCYEKLEQPSKAAELFIDYTSKGADAALRPWAHYQAGLNLAKLNRLAEAERHMTSALAASPPADLSALSMLKLGEIRAQASDYAGSAQTYRAFLEKFAEHRLAYQAHFGIGWSLENNRQHAEARQWYEKVVAGHNGPTAARAQFQIGETHFAEGNYEKAIASLLAVADVYGYPEWAARATFEAGRAFEQLKQPMQAKRQYEAVISKYKDAPEAELARKRLAALER